MKIKFKNVEIGDIHQDMTDREAAILSEIFADAKSKYALKEELEQIEREIEEETETCPECGASLVHAVLSNNPMGVGKTYTQKMRPFTIFYDVVCSKCGLVLRHGIHEVHR